MTNQPDPNATVSYPTGGKDYREHILNWMVGEEPYVSEKFDGTEKNEMVDRTLREHYDIDEFWYRQVNQYYDRARMFLREAFKFRMSLLPEDEERAVNLEKAAQQAVAKAAMTAKGFAESMIRVYGEMPKPGLSSGNLEVWHPKCENCGQLIEENDPSWIRQAGTKRFFHASCVEASNEP